MMLQQSLQYLELGPDVGKSALEIIQLLDDPTILQTVVQILPPISASFKECLEKQYFLYVNLPQKICMILQESSPEDKASIKVKELLEREFSRT